MMREYPGQLLEVLVPIAPLLVSFDNDQGARRSGYNEGNSAGSSGISELRLRWDAPWFDVECGGNAVPRISPFLSSCLSGPRLSQLILGSRYGRRKEPPMMLRICCWFSILAARELGEAVLT